MRSYRPDLLAIPQICTQTTLVNIWWRGIAPKPIKLSSIEFNVLWLRYGVRCINKYRSAQPSTVYSRQTQDLQKCVCTSKHLPVHFLSTGITLLGNVYCAGYRDSNFLSSGCKRESSQLHAYCINEHLSLRQSNALGEHTLHEHACGYEETHSTLCLI